MLKNISSKKLFIFDLDGTLTASKSAITPKMSKLLANLLENKKVAIISGGKFEQLKKQLFTDKQIPKDRYQNLSAFPTNSTSHYTYKNRRWTKKYENNLLPAEKKRILSAIKELQSSPLYIKPKKTYGKLIEDRNSQITFSTLGQNTPLPIKISWNKKFDLRPKYIFFLKPKLKNFEIRQAGLTSIDINRKGVDKSYGVKKILKELKISKKDAVFMGDAFYPGGNDAPARKSGVYCIPVSGPKETEKIIKSALR